MKIIAYKVISDCIERGINYGYMRAYKHTDTPTEDALKNELEQAIMNELCDYIDFDEDVTEIKPKNDEKD